MAWIETVTGNVVNLDNVEYLSVDHDTMESILWANGSESGHPIYDEHIDEDLYGQFQRFNRLMVQIAQIARGNAYISQDDIRRMMDDLSPRKGWSIPEFFEEDKNNV